ncbi:MAG: pitrilysin family protein [Acidobacteria bacterium]|nr:pitrilysin family protein [Acidobacteriota bacterium]
MSPARQAAAVLAAAVLLLPGGTAAQVKNWPSESAPKPLKARPVTFPPYEVRTLPNGLQVVVVQHHEQPSVSVRILVGAGSAQDPGGKPGIANMVASLLDQGTTTRSAKQIAEAVDTIGGQVRIGAGTDLTFAYITVLKDSFAAGFDMLSEIVRTPAFSSGEIDRVRQQIRSALKVSYDDPAYLATTVFERLVYGSHPYGLPGSGTPDSIERITRDDLLAYHQRYYAPNVSILAIVGDVVPAEAFAAAEQAFGSWPRREVVPMLAVSPPPPTRRIVIIDKPGSTQTEIRAGHLAIRRNATDFAALDLAIRVLGGDGANRLQQVLRMERGLTYGASADLETYRNTGDIVAETDTQSETTGEALRVIVDEFFRIEREAVEFRELEDAKAYMTGNFPLTIETPDAISTKVLTALFYGLPLKDLETFRERVNAVTTLDIERVTRAYLKPDRLSIVLVGNAAAFLAELQRVGFRNCEVVPLRDLDLTAPDLKRPRAPAGAGFGSPVEVGPPMTKGDWENAKAVVMRTVSASGGAEALQRVRTVRARAESTMTTPAGQVRATTQTFIEYPFRLRVEATLPKQIEIVQACADGAAWLKDVNGARDAPPAMKDEMALSLRRDWIMLLRDAMNDKLMGKRLPDARGLADRPLYVVELWADDMLPVRLSVDGGTGRLVSLSYDTKGPGGVERTTETYDDFRLVDGLLVPFSAVVRLGAVPILERTLTDYRVNVELDPAIFQKPR